MIIEISTKCAINIFRPIITVKDFDLSIKLSADHGLEGIKVRKCLTFGIEEVDQVTLE